MHSATWSLNEKWKFIAKTKTSLVFICCLSIRKLAYKKRGRENVQENRTRSKEPIQLTEHTIANIVGLNITMNYTW